MADILYKIDRKHQEKVGKLLAADSLDALETLTDATPYQFHKEKVDKVVAHALKSFEDDEDLDKWLAPRIHYLVRVPRSEAADSGIWTWLATGVFRPYMLRRWPPNPKAQNPWWRYNDVNVLRNGVARLWWAAEMVRDGSDYSLVPAALHKVRVFQNVGELRYSWHRETARAFTRVLRDYDDIGDRLSPIFNAYLATQALEQFDRDAKDSELTSWDPTWAEAEPDLKKALGPIEQLEGPAAGFTRADVEDKLYAWLKDILVTTK